MTHPRKSLNSNSVSSVARDEMTASKYLTPVPVYAHWLAIKLLKVLDSARSQMSRSTMEFTVATEKFIINRSHLEETADAIKISCKMKTSKVNEVPHKGVLADSSLYSSELAVKAITSCHLDRFLFSGEDARIGFCLH